MRQPSTAALENHTAKLPRTHGAGISRRPVRCLVTLLEGVAPVSGTRLEGHSVLLS